MLRARPFHLRAAVAALAFAGLATVAAVPTAGDTRDERDEVRRTQAAVAADLDVLAAQDAEIEAALATVAANLAAEQEALAIAQAEAERTEARLAEALAVERATEREIARTEELIRTLAVQAYVGSSSSPPLSFLLDSDDPLEISHRSTLADSANMDLNDALDRLEDLQAQLEAARHDAEAAAAQAEALQVEVEGRVAALEVARAQHESLAAEVSARIEHRLSEAASLSSLDAELSAQITAEEVALGQHVAQVALRNAGVTLSAPPPLRTVEGLTVHADIADAVEAMVVAAREDGLELGGGGYRDQAQQWALRVAHCADPVNSPASSCAPPTAQVGHSNHERGMAIDFTCNGGGAIASHEDPCYLWLEANALRFGFHNLPSEPWHWSVDGN